MQLHPLKVDCLIDTKRMLKKKPKSQIKGLDLKNLSKIKNSL